MKNIYYTIWADGIIRMKSLPQNDGLWKYYSMIFMTLSMSINLLVITTLIEKYIIGYDFYSIRIEGYEDNNWMSLVEFLILYSMPIGFLNYMLIFYKDKYEGIIASSNMGNGKLFFSYFIASLFVPLLLMFIGGLFL